jgi:hypothetical protein
MNATVIQLEGDAAALTFADASFEDEPGLGRQALDYWFECDVTLSTGTQEWTLHLKMIEPYRADMLCFFEQLAEAKDRCRLRWQSEYAELHFDVSTEEHGWASFAAEIWWPPDYEQREQMQFRVPTERLPSFTEQMRHFVRLDRGERLTASD